MGHEVVGNTLGGLGNHVLVHAVGAHAQRAAQTSGAKLEAAVEGVKELVLVTGCDEGVELLLEVGDGDLLGPKVDYCLNVFVHKSFPSALCRRVPPTTDTHTC